MAVVAISKDSSGIEITWFINSRVVPLRAMQQLSQLLDTGPASRNIILMISTQFQETTVYQAYPDCLVIVGHHRYRFPWCRNETLCVCCKITRENKQCCLATREDSPQPRHQFSLTSVFAAHMKKTYKYPLSTKQRPWPDWVDAQAGLRLRFVHTNFVFLCHAMAQVIKWSIAWENQCAQHRLRSA